jgi:Ca2+-binding RTX toxin-like protein
LFLLRTETNMSNIIAGNRGRGAAATAITVALILMTSLPAILTTTEASTISGGNAYCNDIQFRTFESATYYSKLTDDTITIETSQDKYSVDIDYFRDSGDVVVYYKNVAAEDPPGNVLLPAGEIITITLPHDGALFDSPTSVTLYNDKVTDCETFRGGSDVEDRDKMALEIVSIEETDELPSTAKLTVQVPDASEVDEHFTKLGVQFPYGAEVQEYYLISDRVQVSPPSITCEGQTATIVGTSGNDNNIRGTSGRDVIAALGGNDRINALSGNDIVCGGAGDDVVDGGSGIDRLYGEENDDRLDGGNSRDNGDGGTGFDGCVRVETVTNCEA